MPVNIYLVIALIFFLTFFGGKLVEKFKIPWIFAALIIGIFFSYLRPINNIISSKTFSTFSEIGMYLLLFIVGFELDIKQLKKKSGFIFKSAIVVVFLEGILGAIMVHLLFDYSWFISVLAALSFATVGEAILIPILEEFKAINTTLGQAIIGIGTADDIIEIVLLLIASAVVGKATNKDVYAILIALAGLFLLTFVFMLFSKKRIRFKFKAIDTLLLFVLASFFIFIGIGITADAAPLAAILAGVSVRLFIPKERIEHIENDIRYLTYGFFAPLFFVKVGSELNMSYLFSYPVLVLFVVALSSGAKLLGSFIMGKKELGFKGSILLGVGLSVRFSTSIIIIKFLYDNSIINIDLYSVIVASSIVFMFIIPVVFSRLISKYTLKYEN